MVQSEEDNRLGTKKEHDKVVRVTIRHQRITKELNEAGHLLLRKRGEQRRRRREHRTSKKQCLRVNVLVDVLGQKAS